MALIHHLPTNKLPTAELSSLRRAINQKNRRARLAYFSFSLVLFFFIALMFFMQKLTPLFEYWFPKLKSPMYNRESFVSLTWSHIELVGASSLIAIFIGVGLGIFVTRRSGQAFEPMVSTVSAIGQTFPPAAVLAIAVPMVGFGFFPALIALCLYGLLPIIENTIQGINNIPKNVVDSAEGMGMNPLQRLYQIEMPLAAPIILVGIRISIMVNIGTATISSTVGAQSLGTPIIAGLVNENIAYVIQGSILVGLLAIVIDRGLDIIALKINNN